MGRDSTTERISIGIYTHAEPERLRETLASLRANTTSAGVQTVLLGDGPDEATERALARVDDIPQSNTRAALGTAACFNRLVASGEASVYVLLESGVRVGVGWLEQLLAALDADESHGIAGPSTNLCWNEQRIRQMGGVVVSAAVSLREVDRIARGLASRFAGPSSVRTLAPLYSLADFCYAVRREVVEAIGGADEAYGLGPCWEMDYNIRAARAGFEGVWARSAYVHRAQPTERRRRMEALHFDASRRLYQERFCGARLRGEKSDYRAHCRGDVCRNFAPASLIRIKQPLPVNGDGRVDRCETTGSVSHSPRRASASAPAALASVHTREPLVSCIMPTANRRAYVPQAIRYFQRQDYANLELLIVDDGATAPVEDCVPANDPRIRYIRLEERLTLGAKRNFACREARGDFIVHWDDDDWYPHDRVRRQLEPLLDGRAEISGTSQLFYYEPATERAWRYKYAPPHGRAWVAGNSLAYRKSFWARHRFPDLEVGEDTRFVWNAASRAVCDLDDPSLCVGTVHAANTSRKATGGTYWRTEPRATLRALLGDDLDFYSVLVSAGAASGRSTWPLVSCIMPTFNRRSFIPLALELFSCQDYPNKELIIIDDGARDPVGDLAAGIANVRYVRLKRRASIGAKRNLACREARGEIIAHWDDDDWYAPERLRYQAEPIVSGEADLTGLVNSFVVVLPGGEFWTTTPELHPRMFVGDVHGGTLCFARSLWKGGVRYPESNLAEDAALLREAVRRGRRLARLPNPGLFVYVRHGRNAWAEYAPGRFLDPAGWRRIGPPSGFTADALAAFRTAASNLSRET